MEVVEPARLARPERTEPMVRKGFPDRLGCPGIKATTATLDRPGELERLDLRGLADLLALLE